MSMIITSTSILISKNDLSALLTAITIMGLTKAERLSGSTEIEKRQSEEMRKYYLEKLSDENLIKELIAEGYK